MENLTFIGGRFLSCTIASDGVTVMPPSGTSDFYAGEYVAGPGIPWGTTIKNVSTSSLTLSKQAVSGTVTLAFGDTDVADGWNSVTRAADGLFTLPTPTLGVGSHKILATYNPIPSMTNPDFPPGFGDDGADPQGYPQVVKQNETTTTVSAGPSGQQGITATATVTVSPGSGTPAGTVTFQDRTAVTPQVWFAPEGRSDVLDLLQAPPPPPHTTYQPNYYWPTVQPQVNVLALSEPEVTKTPQLNVVNTWSKLVAAGIVQDLNQWKIALAYGTGVIKPQYFSGGVFDPTMPETLAESDIDNVDSTIVSGQSISVKYLEMDSPYFNGITDPAVPMTTDEIAKTVSTFMADIDAYYEKKSEVPAPYRRRRPVPDYPQSR